jgi:septal ring factor EnvC (AmiA/AmiB activator)
VDKRIKVDSAEYGKLLDELKNIKDKWASEIQSINTERTDLIKSNDEYIADNDNLNGELNNLKKQSYDDQKIINKIKSTNELYLQNYW